ncbi:MAG: hypothetical protein SCK29_09020 [Bacillota bacterium]|nr:hypothetical protein [Bacillota bacterium]MDW7684240.1 hypothetical protein [Bacillota bacterium]
MFKKKKNLVYAVVITAAAALVFTSALAAFSMTGLRSNSGSSGQNLDSAVADLEYQISQYEDNLEKAPDNFYLLTQLGNSYYQLGMVYNSMANDEKAKESFAAAVEPYGKALEVEPTDVNVRVDRAVSAFWSESYDLAEEEFQTAIETDPTHAKAYFNYGIFQYYGRNNPAEALVLWNQVLELNPADDPELVSTTRSWIAQLEEDSSWQLQGDPAEGETGTEAETEDAAQEEGTEEENVEEQQN